MIIKITVHDNALTHYFKEFVFDNDFWGELNMAYNLTGGMFGVWESSVSEKRQAMREKRKRLLNTNVVWKKTDLEYKEICNEVIRLWKLWIKYRNYHKELDFDPLVSIQYSLKEHDGNGEEFYYFSCCGQGVIM